MNITVLRGNRKGRISMGKPFLIKTGTSVALSADGSIVAIGATLNDGQAGINSGHVRVYEYNGSSWKQKGPDIDGEAEGDESGYSVSMSADGSIVAIGARFNDASGDSSGHVRVYKFTGWGLGA